MRIDINLATQPYEDSRRFWTYWGSVLGVLVLITLVLAYLAIAGFIQATHERAKIAGLQREIAAYDQEKAAAQTMLSLPENRIVRLSLIHI